MWLVSASDWARSGGETGRRRSLAASVAAVAVGLLLVAGCRVPGTSSSAAAPTASGTVTVTAVPGVADAPLYIGIRDGLFRQAGLTVRILPSSSISAEVSALRQGHADIAFGDYADMFYAQEAKPSPGLSIVADGYDAAPSVMEVLTLPKSPITAPSELAGKVIGTSEPQVMPTGQPVGSQPYSLETLATWSVLSADNVKLSSVTWKPMPTGSLLNALKSHQVSAILATEPTIYQAESQLGAVPVLDSCTGATANLPLAGYFASPSFVKGHSDQLAAFRAALLKAQADASMSGPVQTVLTKYDRLNPETASLVTFGNYPTSLQAANLQQVADLMFLYNTLPAGTLTVSSMIAK